MVSGLLWNLEHQGLKPGNRGGEGRPGWGLGPRVLGAAATQLLRVQIPDVLFREPHARPPRMPSICLSFL